MCGPSLVEVFGLLTVVAYLLCGMWGLPGPRIEPVSPALAGRFLSTLPPGKYFLGFIFLRVKFPLLFFLFKKIKFFFLLYNIVLVLPYIDMNQPWVYMRFPF